MLTLREELSKTHGIANDGTPFIIAEMSGNHNQSLDRALAIVDAAAATGADALKIQTFTADSMTLDLSEGEFTITDPKSLWVGRTLYSLYQEAKTPAEWHKPIFDRAKEKGILAFSTPFSEDAVELLESLDVPAYKIASFEAIDLPLVRCVAETGKPMIISTGMATPVEIGEAVETALSAGCTNLTLLKCTSSYPASPENTNLVTMPLLGQTWGVNYGLSDHTMGTGVSVAATALGASVIEKHFIIDRSEGGVDSAFSLEPDEFTALMVETERAAQAMGKVWWGGTASEQAGRKKRRSLYIAHDLKAGDVLTPDNLRRIRPGLGLAPRHYDVLIGRQVGRDVARGTPMSWDLLDQEQN
ncbi:pseudaminic acid synthase [Phaeobacter gallaeciensis]|uniref:Pseudaminic acid synthase n=2 Tax=Roseobacteraceae TaxID=2854170 RepID=A0A366WLP8_9RHOB|nr:MULTISPECIES: pseudaminic acid synthase [Roseobacteraceae]MBT3141773.1 pseudaminic acid synthase [Falsiruegeria litorea]RBW50296.1 pseudaminic acid synthase [Phaeobacter gallaeciensis]